jgi:hypothetical protein
MGTGLEAALLIGAGTAAAGAAYGAHEQHRARKNAEGFAKQQQADNEATANTVRTEQGKLNEARGRSKQKLNLGRARANRARQRGGLFGGDMAPDTTDRLG